MGALLTPHWPSHLQFHLDPRKLILFIVTVGCLLVFLGGALLTLYILYQGDINNIRPFIIIGQHKLQLLFHFLLAKENVDLHFPLIFVKISK